MPETVVTYVRMSAAARLEAERVAAEHGVPLVRILDRALEFYLTEKCGWKPPAEIGASLP